MRFTHRIVTVRSGGVTGIRIRPGCSLICTANGSTDNFNTRLGLVTNLGFDTRLESRIETESTRTGSAIDFSSGSGLRLGFKIRRQSVSGEQQYPFEGGAWWRTHTGFVSDLVLFVANIVRVRAPVEGVCR